MDQGGHPPGVWEGEAAEPNAVSGWNVPGSGLGSLEQSMDQVGHPPGVREGEAAVPNAVSGWKVPGSGLGSLEQSMDQVGHPPGVWEGEAAVANAVSGWNVPGSGMVNEASRSEIRGKVIMVTLGKCTRRIGIDGSPEAIKEVIKSAFGLRTRRPFWLEDENGVVRTLDRDMPLKAYTLHLDGGLKANICIETTPNHMPCHVLEKTFYTEDELSSFLLSCNWKGMTGLRSNRMVDSFDDLISDEVYHGIPIFSLDNPI